MNANILLNISFDGQNFSGWENTPDKRTVSTVLKDALEKITRSEVNITSYATLLSGCHAPQFFVFWKKAPPLPENFLHKVNRCLPEDMAVKTFFLVEALELHPIRYFYEYHIHYIKQPFLENKSYFLNRPSIFFDEPIAKHFKSTNSSSTDIDIQLQETDMNLIIKMNGSRLTADTALQTVSGILQVSQRFPAYGLYATQVAFSEIQTQQIDSEYFFIPEKPYFQ